MVILPYLKNKVLMQLRDFKTGIAFPGQWGFFSGSLEKGETPDDAAHREMWEEIGYRTDQMHFLSTLGMPELDNLITHAYFCELTTPLDNISLHEGYDFGLFTRQEIRAGQLFSGRMGKHVPVIPSKYIHIVIDALMLRLHSGGGGVFQDRGSATF